MVTAVLWSVRMERLARWTLLMLIGCFAPSCSVPPPPPDKVAPSQATRQTVLERVSAVVVTDRQSLDHWVSRNFSTSQSPGDADGGSAAPIAPDGYFLTADHVLARMAGRHVFVIYGQGGRLRPTRARVVWRSESADLALLKVEEKTPYYYEWTDPAKWLPVGTRVMHGGIATGFKSPDGKLGTSLAPQRSFTGTRKFKIDIPLQPGDSGGPVVDAFGRLVGINSAVEFLVPMETPFFIDSEGNRPNTRQIDELIRADRSRNSGA